MAKLVYGLNTSIDGYISDEEGDFGFTKPDEEVHRFWNEIEQRSGTHLLGRRMYETLTYWEDPPELDQQPAYMQEFAAAWRDTDKIVYSRSLDSVSTARTRLDREFDPAAVRRLKEEADRDLIIGGPGLAAEALRAGLVDQLDQVVWPVVIGGGNNWLPAGIKLEFELLEERRFASGAVHLRFRARD
jgi:dihydrofolate reductase